jgi:hypothetical protein
MPKQGEFVFERTGGGQRRIGNRIDAGWGNDVVIAFLRAAGTLRWPGI